jgi:hypothetical protein
MTANTQPKVIAHGTIGTGFRYDLDAILDDPRNWRGVTGQKEQALMRQIVRQSNGPDKDAPQPFRNMPPRIGSAFPINLKDIRRYTGIKRETALPLLDGLHRKGFIALSFADAGTRQAVYRVAIRHRNAANWPAKYLHTLDDIGARDCPY